MSTFPSVLTTYTDPNASDKLNSPSHSSIESAQNSGLKQLEAVIGTVSSAVGTITYDLRSPSSNGGGHIQSVTKGGTGQTTYQKGDLLVATSSSVLSKLAVSATDGYALITDSNQAAGIKWGVPGNIPTVAVYSTASTLTWVKPSVLTYLLVTLVGGGGGGGGSANGSSGVNVGSGGGGGGFSKKLIPASSLGATENFTVGAAGTAGSASGGDGGAGGTSSFGTTSILSATGGSGGLGSSGGVNKLGSAGGIGSGGDLNVAGSPGGNSATAYFSGNGGSSPLGGGGTGNNNGTGGNGRAYGGGGGGGASSGGAGQTGGAGYQGAVIIEEY